MLLITHAINSSQISHFSYNKIKPKLDKAREMCENTGNSPDYNLKFELPIQPRFCWVYVFILHLRMCVRSNFHIKVILYTDKEYISGEYIQGVISYDIMFLDIHGLFILMFSICIDDKFPKKCVVCDTYNKNSLSLFI